MPEQKEETGLLKAVQSYGHRNRLQKDGVKDMNKYLEIIIIIAILSVVLASLKLILG